MSRKYNCKHPDRKISNYPLRLVKRGLHKTPVMASLADLRRKQKNIESVPLAKMVYAGWDFEEEEERILDS